MAKKHISLSQFKHVELIANLFGGDLLSRILNGQEEGCREKDTDAFRLSQGLEVHNEAQRAYLYALGGWSQFVNEPRDSMPAAKAFALHLLSNGLNYQFFPLTDQGVSVGELNSPATLFPDDNPADIKHEKMFELSGFLAPSADSVGNIPLLIVPRKQDLDKNYAKENGTRFVPFFYMQEFLNKSDKHLWGIVTNGCHWRLLRDNNSLSRPCYLDFDMECVLSEKNAAAFAGVYRCIHSSRAYQTTLNDVKTCLWEGWFRQLEQSGQRVREGLREGVELALCALGEGFLQQNSALRQQIIDGTLSPVAYYNELLHLIYRFIFLFVLEEKQLLHEPKADSEAVHRYQQGYSMSRLVNRALTPDRSTRYCDLWTVTQLVFNALGRENGEEILALPGIGGIFQSNQCAHLQACELSNYHFLHALKHLHWAEVAGQLSRVDYKNMGAEELGSIYESLLELTPKINLDATTFSFENLQGNQRKTTGSYYTPDMLVRQILSTTLKPLIEEKVANAAEGQVAQDLLSLRLVDPACGSGHFLLAAARQLAEAVARSRHYLGQVSELDYRTAMHDVISNCIYGVDINPMAVELVRMNLWLEGHVPGRALSFLDHHIRCGNSLLGVHSWEGLEFGIPDDAYKVREGDLASVRQELNKINKERRKKGCNPEEILPALRNDGSRLDSCMPSPHYISEVDAQGRLYHEELVKDKHSPRALAADVLIGAFLLPKDSSETIPTSVDTFGLLEMGVGADSQAVQRAHEICEQSQVFHWPLYFPSVMQDGGFDCVIGNPPWEKFTFQEQEWFAHKHKDIANAAGSIRKRMIEELSRGNDEEVMLYNRYNQEYSLVNAQSAFYHVSDESYGQYPLTGRGIVNLYALFAERCLNITKSSGRMGIIAPTGIASDDSTKFFFRHLTENRKLISLFDFENRAKLFPAVDSRMRFSCLTMGLADKINFAVYLHKEEDLEDFRRIYQLSAAQMLRINPNTGTCPMFRAQKDAELTQIIYDKVPVLWLENPLNNSWCIKFKMMFNMTSDSNLFIKSQQIDCVPLYEGKLIHQFDHRWATYNCDGSDGNLTQEQKEDSCCEITPRYWVKQSEVQKKLVTLGNHKKYLIGFRDIARATDERTCIASLFPVLGAGHNLPLIFTDKEPKIDSCLVANLNSLVFDYISRQKVGGTHMTLFILKQLPVLPPERYSNQDISYISERVLQLSYTSESMRPYAQEMGYTGEPFSFNIDKRLQLRAELDAYYAKLYGLSREDLAYILDPTTYYTDGDCPTVTFPGLQKKELNLYGEYRTERLVLESFDLLSVKKEFHIDDFIYHYIEGCGEDGCSLAELFSAYYAIWHSDRRSKIINMIWQEMMQQVPVPEEEGFIDIITDLRDDDRIRVTQDHRFILSQGLELNHELSLAELSSKIMRGKFDIIDLLTHDASMLKRIYYLLAA